MARFSSKRDGLGTGRGGVSCCPVGGFRARTRRLSTLVILLASAGLAASLFAADPAGAKKGHITFCGEVKGVVFLEHGANDRLAAATLFLKPSQYANLKKVQLNRARPDGKGDVTTVDVEKFAKNNYQDDIPLQDGDIVFVPASASPFSKPSDLPQPPVRGGLSLAKLQNDPQLTPATFPAFFSSFKYLPQEGSQPPEVFITSQAGNAADYAVLAGRVLKAKGFSTRLILIRLASQRTHTVCYLPQDKGYLEFKAVGPPGKPIPCGATIREIANQAAGALKAYWTSASEFTMDNEVKRMLATVVRTDPPEKDPVAQP